MELTIRPLSKDTAPDFFDFFDKRAFGFEEIARHGDTAIMRRALL